MNIKPNLDGVEDPKLDFEIERIQQHVGQASHLLRALANAQRLRILCLLVAGELSVNQINNGVSLSQSALSQHLAVLRRQGIVTTRREAQTIFYTLASGPAQTMLEALYGIYCSTADPPSDTRP